jgi:transglutaminase/protease-like cytokinesis protein 3
MRLNIHMRCILLLLIVFVSTGALCQKKDFWNVDFRKADSIALTFAGHDLRDPHALALKLVKDVHTDVETFRVIFRWITDNIAYDYPLYLEIVKKEKKLRYSRKKLSAFSQHASKKMYSRMIIKKKTICSGYATLLEYMCQEAGLECEIVTGYARNFDVVSSSKPNHAWNAIKLGTKWYLSDVTWASGAIDSESRFVKSFNDAYFLTEPSLFIATHFPVEARWRLIKDGPSLNHFFLAPFRPEGFISNWINNYYPLKGTTTIRRNQLFELRFTGNVPICIHSSAKHCQSE